MHSSQTAEIAGDAVTTYASYPTNFGSNDGKNVNTFSPSATQFSGSGAGAFCLVLNQIQVRLKSRQRCTCSDNTRPSQENDGVLGSNLQTTVANVLTIVSSLVGPALQALGCPAAGT